MRLDTSPLPIIQPKQTRAHSLAPNQKLAGERGITWRCLGAGPGTASVAAFCIASLRSHTVEDVRPSLLSYRSAWLDRPAPRRRILRLCGTACTRQTAWRWLLVLSNDATCALLNPRVVFHRPWAQLVDNCRLASIDARHLCATRAGKGARSTAPKPIPSQSGRSGRSDFLYGILVELARVRSEAMPQTGRFSLLFFTGSILARPSSYEISVYDPPMSLAASSK